MPEQMEKHGAEAAKELQPKTPEAAPDLNKAMVVQSEAEMEAEKDDAEGELAALRQLLSDSKDDMSEEERNAIQMEINELAGDVGVIEDTASPEVANTPEALTEREKENLNALDQAFSHVDDYLRLQSTLDSLRDGMPGRRSIAEDSDVIRESINGTQGVIGLQDRVQDIFRNPESKQAILDEFKDIIAATNGPLQDATDRVASWAGRIRETFGDYEEVNSVDHAFRRLDQDMQTAIAALREAGG